MTVWAYARVSTEKQDTALQEDALSAAGVHKDHIITETVSGAAKHRPKFDALLDQLRAGDELVVWKLDRLGRNVVGIHQTIERLTAAGIGVRVTTLGVDLTTPVGRLIFGVLAQIAAFEREQIVERINAGLRAAKARGKQLGRQHRLTAHQRREAARMVDEGKSYGEVADLFGVGKTVVFDAVKQIRALEASS